MEAWPIRGRGTYLIDIVGESHYRSELETIVGDQREAEFTAELVPEPSNPFDSNAVAVYRQQGSQIGHLTAERASSWQPELLAIERLGGRITCAVAGRSRKGAPIGVLLDVSIQGIKAELRRRAPEIAQRLRDEGYAEAKEHAAPPVAAIADPVPRDRSARSVGLFLAVIGVLVLVPIFAITMITRDPQPTQVVRHPRRVSVATSSAVTATIATPPPLVSSTTEPQTTHEPTRTEPLKVAVRSPVEQVFVADGLYYREDCVHPTRAVRTPKAAAIRQGYRPAPNCYTNTSTAPDRPGVKP